MSPFLSPTEIDDLVDLWDLWYDIPLLSEEDELALGLGAYAGGVAEDATTGFTLGGPVGAAVGAAAGIAIGAVAYVLASYRTTGGGGSNPGRIVPYFPSAQRYVFGDDVGPGNDQAREADLEPNLRLRHNILTRAKAPPDLSPYFNRSGQFNSTIDWDGFYLKHYGLDKTLSGLGQAINRPLYFSRAHDQHGGIYIPEIMAVKYWWQNHSKTDTVVPWVGIGPGLLNSVTGARRNTDSTVITAALMADQEWRDQHGVLGVTAVDNADGEEPVIDLRNTNGDGILWPLKTMQPYTDDADIPHVTVLYRYRKIDWYALMELNFQWLLIDQNWQQTGLSGVIQGRQEVLEYTLWYAFWAGVR